MILKPQQVILSPDEYSSAASIGMLKNFSEVKRNTNSDGRKGNGIHTSTLGCIGEYVVSKYLKLPWDLSRKCEFDVGPFQVRTTDEDEGCLLLRPKDNDLHPFILVTGRVLNWHIRGWLFAIEGKVKRFEETYPHDRPPYFLVPQQFLKSIHDNEIKNIIRNFFKPSALSKTNG